VVLFVASRLMSLRRSLQLTIGLLIFKEIFDVFAKTRLEYIRPPTLDLGLDMIAGGVGIAAGYFLARRWQGSRS
jgi:hypothetical protein